MIISNNVIVCVDENECEYDFNNLSDGERQVFYFIANVLGNEMMVILLSMSQKIILILKFAYLYGMS